MSAKIRVRWPDGAICGICFREAAHTYGVCAGCGDDRLLPGRDEHAKPICRDCAGITTTMTCGRCGVEAERFRNGQCARCVIEADLTLAPTLTLTLTLPSPLTLLRPRSLLELAVLAERRRRGGRVRANDGEEVRGGHASRRCLITITVRVS